jgi:hypothetical protein
VERVRTVLNHETTDNDPEQDPTLDEIMHLVDMHGGVTSEGWTSETARLFAIDTAMAFIRRNLSVLPEPDRHILVTRLQEARSLVVSGRDGELGFLQSAIESHLSMVSPGRQRGMWLAAIDALLPSPYRAALVSTKNALAVGTTETFVDLSNLLRDRLLARLGEGSLLSEPTTELFLTA